MPAKRLSTAFDSVTLYGDDPALRPDIYGKVGNSGVSIATLDDMKVLYAGFDLCSPTTSVSMTINGPAPTILAMFMNTAIDQQLDKFKADNGREPTADEAAKITRLGAGQRARHRAGRHPEGRPGPEHLHLLDRVLAEGDGRHRRVLRRTTRCATSTRCRSRGYHIAEAGANPISQLAFTLSNGFTFVEAYLARGMHIDDFAPNLSFFFSNGMDPEYTVLGRVARRIWAVAMRDKYGANERIAEAEVPRADVGPLLHAQEIAVQRHPHHAAGADRDLRQLQLAAHQRLRRGDHHADRGISVRRAMAIQLIINREWGLAKNENPNQGAFIIEELTELVEEAVLQEFEKHRRARRRAGRDGNRLPARQDPGRVDATTRCRSTTARYPIIGVNTFRNPNGARAPATIELARSTDDEKQSPADAPGRLPRRATPRRRPRWPRLQQAVIDNDNVFDALMDAVRVCSLGQITTALFEVGGQYRRNM